MLRRPDQHCTGHGRQVPNRVNGCQRRRTRRPFLRRCRDGDGRHLRKGLASSRNGQWAKAIATVLPSSPTAGRSRARPASSRATTQVEASDRARPARRPWSRHVGHRSASTPPTQRQRPASRPASGSWTARGPARVPPRPASSGVAGGRRCRGYRRPPPASPRPHPLEVGADGVGVQVEAVGDLVGESGIGDRANSR